jgi:cell division protein FtsA
VEKRNYNIVTLDPGTADVTIAVGGVDDEGKVHIVDIITWPMQGIVRGEVSNRQQVSASVSEAIRGVEQKLGMRISDVWVSASGRHIKCTDYDYFVFVGERSDGEIRSEDVARLHDEMNNVQAEDGIRILDRIPLDYVIDERNSVKDPVGMFGKKLSSTFNFVLASTTPLDRMDKTLLAMGVSTRRTFPGALASAEAVLLPEEKEMGVAVVDLGAGTTDVSVWYAGAMRFVRSIPLGAADINNDIHQQGILEKRVEELKKSFGVAMVDLVDSDKLITIAGRSPREKQDISQKNLAIIIENRLVEIIGYVMAEIGDSGYADRLKGGIVLTGGGSQLEGIDALFSRQTGLEVRLALPDVNVVDECVALAHNPAHATAIGLLLKAAEQSRGQIRQSVQESPKGGYKPETTYRPPKTSGEIKESVKEPVVTNAPDFEDDEEYPKDSRGKWWKRFGKRVMDGFMPETLDGDEDI